MRIVFMGTPEFAVPLLDALVGAGHEIAAVYTQPPRPAGRGKALRPSPVHRAAVRHGFPVETPERFRDASVVARFASLEADVAVVVAYGQILPQDALDAPRLGCLNAHASLLPRWRGAAPIQRAIMAGDRETGVCIMQMEAGLDTGPVLACEAVPIGETDTAGDLHDRLAALSARLMTETLSRLAEGPVTAGRQSVTGVTYAAKIEKAEARIDWSRPAEKISAHIRGLSPFPGAWCEIGGERLKVFNAAPGPAVIETVKLSGSRDTPIPGTILDNALTVACGEGSLRLTRLQRAGRGPQDAESFLNGFPVPPGSVLT
ncbi:MAG: methionyl-tRNA formyltransferase [Pseudomonadota bacterium]